MVILFSSRSLKGQVKKLCPAHIFFIEKKKHILHTKICSEMLNVHTSHTEFDPQTFSKFNVTEGKVQNKFPVHMFLIERHWKIVLKRNVVACHDFYLSHSGKFKVTGMTFTKLVFCLICLSYGETLKFIPHTKTAYDLNVCKDFI